MEGNTAEFHIGSESELYNYINIHAVTPTKERGRKIKNNENPDIQHIWTRSSGIQ